MVTLPYIIFLVKPSNFFMFSQKEKKIKLYWDKIFMLDILTRRSEQIV